MAHISAIEQSYLATELLITKLKAYVVESNPALQANNTRDKRSITEFKVKIRYGIKVS